VSAVEPDHRDSGGDAQWFFADCFGERRSTTRGDVPVGWALATDPETLILCLRCRTTTCPTAPRDARSCGIVPA